jgi:hypothetical protein
VKKAWLMILLAVVLVVIAVYSVLRRQQNQETIEALGYNRTTGQWESTTANTYGVQPDKVTLPTNDDGLSNPTILRGYFERYEAESQILYLKATVPFSQGNLFKSVTVKLSPQQSLTCVPRNYTDPNTGKTYPMSKMLVPVRDQAVLYMPNETNLAFTDFVDNSTDLTFLLLQLTSPYQPEKVNYVQKLIVTGLCE